MWSLVSVLLVDRFSAIALPSIYKAPLDVKSLHKVPVEDRRHCGGNFVWHFLAQSSWALIYMPEGLASTYFGQNFLCDDGDEYEGLLAYLVASGAFVILFGFGAFLLSRVALSACPAPFKCMGPCFNAIRSRVQTTGVAKGVWFDLVYQVQGVGLYYLKGSF